VRTAAEPSSVHFVLQVLAAGAAELQESSIQAEGNVPSELSAAGEPTTGAGKTTSSSKHGQAMKAFH